MARDEVHKNRCHVKFPELFSSYPYRVNVTAVNSLGRASTAISFEESSIGTVYIKLLLLFFALMSTQEMLCVV